MSNEAVEHFSEEAVVAVSNPVLSETSELVRLLAAQDLVIGMPLTEYEAPSR